MNQRERDVCLRVREIRERKKWSQPDFAKEIGISKNRLASIEYGRTPLRYGLAVKICFKFDISLEWLATGQEPDEEYIPLLETSKESSKINQNDLLTKVLDDVGGSFSKPPDIKISKKELAKNVPADFDFKRQLAYQIKRVCETTEFKNVTDSWIFYDKVTTSIEGHLRRLRAEGKVIRPITGESLLHSFNYSKTISFLDLTGAATSGKLTPDVKKQLPSLLERLNRATKETGKMTALADYLGVTLASVSRWLSGKRVPNGERVLQMLLWVERQER